MAKGSATPCRGCRRLQAQLDAQRAQLEQLQATVAQLQEQLAAARKGSSTSSKPPSSDIVKPPKPEPPPGQAKRTAPGDQGRVVQQLEIAEVPLLAEEHRSHPGWCPHCCRVHYAPLPAAVQRGGL